MTKKKVTAPLTYNPGKGRPKEHLAYLNYQEMQALKRLNGDNMERGPKGLPSFPPADSRSGSYNSGYGSAASKTTTRSPSSATASISRTTSNVARSPASQGSPVSQRPTSGPLSAPARTAPSQGSPVSQRTTTPARQGSPVSQRPSGGARDSGQAAARSDTAFKQAAERRSAASARSTPALRQDQSKTISAGPMGTQVEVKVQPGAKIRGAIKSVQEAAAEARQPISVKPPAQTMQQLYSQYQQPPSVPPTKTQIAQRLREVYPDRWGKYSLADVERAVDTMAQSLPGEADINKYSAGSMRNLAQVGINQVVRNLSPEQMLRGIDTTGLDIERGTQNLAYPGPRSIGMTGNWPNQTLARQSYETALRSIESAVENRGVSPQARYATNFVAAGTPMVSGVRPVGAPVYGTQFGVDPSGRAAVEARNLFADIKRDYAQYRSPPAGVSVVPVSSTPERAVVPGLIQYPKLDRPMAPTAGRSAVVPTSRKTITERIAPEYRRISEDPTMSGRDLTPRGKQIYDRIISESGDLPISVGGYARQAFGAGVVGAGDIAVPARDVNVAGSVGGASGYSQDVVNDVYAGSVIPPKFRSATQVAAGFPSPIRPLGTAGGVAGLGVTPEQISVPVARANAALTGAPGVGAEASRSVQFVNAGVGGEVAGVPGISPDMAKAAATVSAAEGERIPGLKRVSNIFASGSPADLAKNLREQITEGYETFRPETVTESVPPSQGGLTEEQQSEAKKIIKRGGLAIRVGGVTLSGATRLPFSLGGRYLSKKYQESKLKQLENYAAMTPEKKAVAEARNPELIGWAKELNIPSVNDYSVYQAWATERGLRAPAGGGKSSGILALGGGPSGGATTPAPETPSTPSAPSGRRPDVYYMWDLGVNIPSPSDPNYTQYQAYLAERLAAQQAMGYV